MEMTIQEQPLVFLVFCRSSKFTNLSHLTFHVYFSLLQNNLKQASQQKSRKEGIWATRLPNMTVHKNEVK